MSHKARDETVRKFGAKDSKIKVMISSLMCGGIGRKSHLMEIKVSDILNLQ